jgi:TfoX/Sxy family transcriptional regulator of competence genes
VKLAKSPPELIAAFDALLPPPAERRVMFGYPAGFVNGNLFMSLFAEHMILRLAEPDRRKLLALDGAAPFEPMPGRPMKEYVVVPPALVAAPAKLRRWIARALDFASDMPAKAKKKKKK